MTATASRSGSLPDHLDDAGNSRYAVHADREGRIKPFYDYAPKAWSDDEPNASLWAAQQFCVHIVDNELGTCPFRDRLVMFYADLINALKANINVDADTLIARYNAFVNEYNSTVQPAAANDHPVAPVTAVPLVTPDPTPASQPIAVVERDVDTSSAPRPAPVAEPVVATAPAPVQASEPTTVVERDDNGAPAWLTEFREEFGGKVTKHDTTLYGEDGDAGLVKDVSELRADVDELRAAIPRGDDGHFSFASVRQNVANARTRGVGSMVRNVFVAFLGAFLLAALVVGFIGVIVGFGAIAAISHWLWLITLIGIIAAFVVAVRIHRSDTASAVSREERN